MYFQPSGTYLRRQRYRPYKGYSPIVDDSHTVRHLYNLVHGTIRSCRVVTPNSGIVINISNNGSDITLAVNLTRLHGCVNFSFAIRTIALSPRFNNEPVSCAMLRRLFTQCSVPCRVHHARVNPIIFSCHGRGGPYTLYTGLQHNTLRATTRRLNYGGITLNRRLSSTIRAFCVGL